MGSGLRSPFTTRYPALAARCSSIRPSSSISTESIPSRSGASSSGSLRKLYPRRSFIASVATPDAVPAPGVVVHQPADVVHPVGESGRIDVEIPYRSVAVCEAWKPDSDVAAVLVVHRMPQHLPIDGDPDR